MYNVRVSVIEVKQIEKPVKRVHHGVLEEGDSDWNKDNFYFLKDKNKKNPTIYSYSIMITGKKD